MKPTLQFKLTQHLTLTPQLQESIRLLQLSTVELGQEIERMVQENPLLELEDVSGGETAEYRSLPLDDQPEPLSSELPGIQDDAEAKLLSGGIDAEAKSGPMDEPDWFNDEGSPRNSRDDDEEREFPQQAAEPPNLREHLSRNSASARFRNETGG
jgi:RNA polymerase sigma-54 factor